MDNLEELAKGTPFDGLFEGDKIKPPMKSQSNSQAICWACKKPLNEKGVELDNGELMHESCLYSNSQSELDKILGRFYDNDDGTLGNRKTATTQAKAKLVSIPARQVTRHKSYHL